MSTVNLKVDIPGSSPYSEIFKSISIYANIFGTGLGCHAQGMGEVNISYDIHCVKDEFKVPGRYSNSLKDPTKVKNTFNELVVDKEIRELAFGYLYDSLKVTLEKYSFTLISDNLDRIYTQYTLVTSWFAEYLVKKKGFLGIASPIILNGNYYNSHHHNQIWILTPPTRFAAVVNNSWGQLGQIPDNQETWNPYCEAEGSEFVDKIDYPFMDIVEPKIVRTAGAKPQPTEGKVQTVGGGRALR